MIRENFSAKSPQNWGFGGRTFFRMISGCYIPLLSDWGETPIFRGL